MRLSRKFLGDAFTVVVLFLATTAFQTLIIDVSTPQAVAQGNPLMQSLWIAIYVVAAMRALQHRRLILQILRANMPLVLLVLLALFSVFWSGDPAVTLRRGVAVLATTVLGVDLAVRYSVREQLRLVGITLLWAVTLSILADTLFHGLVPTVDAAYSSAWNGIFAQKNAFARIVVLAAIVILTKTRRVPWNVITAVATLTIAYALIAASRSVTALVVLTAMWVLMLGFQVCRRRWRALIPIGFICALIISCLAPLLSHQYTLFGWLDRDSTLTGRTIIWAESLTSIAKQPILGYGYSAFWDASPEAMRIDKVVRFQVPHAHNAYIDLTLQLGLTGLVLFLVVYCVAVRRAAVYMSTEHGWEAMWPLFYLTFVLLYQITESSIFADNSIFWILYVSTICSVTELTSSDPGLSRVEHNSEIAPGSRFAIDQECA
jgi:exopolysaccharide production protein ExoQ